MKPKHIFPFLALVIIIVLAVMFLNNDSDNIEGNPEDWALPEKGGVSTSTEGGITNKPDYMIPKVSPTKLSELPLLPEDFEEFIIASGTVRFGVPREWRMINASAGQYYDTYLTKDFKEKQVFKPNREGEDSESITISGYNLSISRNVRYSEKYGSFCRTSPNPSDCYQTDLLDDWFTYRLNYNLVSDDVQYIYIAESKILGSLVVRLNPPQTANIEETQNLFKKILETVELVEVAE